MSEIRVGVVGIGRGLSFANGAKFVGMKLVALCDTREKRLQEVGRQYNVATYTEYDKFLEHDMDAVILANYFHQHAPFAIKALEAGKHVMSETMACGKPSEGVALVRAVEKSKKIYVFAENYPYFAYNQEMRKLYQAGEIGEMQYGEGEYNHSMNSYTFNALAPGLNHWRNWIPSTYYCSHALAPIMYITDTHPISVNALSIPAFESDKEKLHVRRGDPGSVILCRMNNESVVRIMGIVMRGHSIWYRIHGTRGLMENLRTGNTNSLRIVHEPWDMKEGDQQEKIYVPDFPEHAEEARNAGHGGGDFFTTYHFATSIRRNENPYFDVYRGVEMAMVGIQAWRSCLNNGNNFEIPDFHDESMRKKYENDNWSPWPEDQGPGQPPSSIKGQIIPSEEGIAYAKQVWKEIGYEDL
ncbi:MAG: Gfo/Idh/MocA family protein [bacterium]